ncbi:hypothetical protein B0A52_04188 [Exophiala mesophila]|uniref:Uncharacterized protein n=1 Tax=Exophiala mesophila TaxID=212818 RepID=A0A438N816_EXOME|nr:hypothetical protein B0A52_04188 [Exophiala mesophila]
MVLISAITSGKAALPNPRTRNIAPTSLSYGRLHILGLPTEIRERIYKIIRIDTQHQARPDLLGQPTCAYKSLGQTCRQLYHEVDDGVPPFLVPHNKIETWLSGPLTTYSAWDDFKSLHVELRHDMDPGIFARFSHCLKGLAPNLEDLRIYCVGNDALGVRTSSKHPACGKFDQSLMPHNTEDLWVAGQGWNKKLTLLQTLPHLFNLRTLVLDNLNVPLLKNHVLANKPCLEKLVISADHRTILHDGYTENRQVRNMISPLLKPLVRSVHVQELTVTFNGIFDVCGLITATGLTLESLTLIVPSSDYQRAAAYHRTWTSDLAQILSILPGVSNLRNLRICFHDMIHDNTHEMGDLMYAFNTSVPRLNSLQSMELHFDIDSPWTPEAFFNALPKSLQRFHIYDKFHFGSYALLARMIGNKTAIATNHQLGTLIGENLSRTDAIAFPTSQLSFVGFEYTVEELEYDRELQDEDVMRVIKINGRLLDRRRNKHLAQFNGEHIPWRTRDSASGEEGYMDADSQTALLKAKVSQLDRPMFSEVPEQHVFAATDDYFGNEAEAEKIFHQEVAVAIDALPPVTYPVMVDVPDKCDHSNHWISA